MKKHDLPLLIFTGLCVVGLLILLLVKQTNHGGALLLQILPATGQTEASLPGSTVPGKLDINTATAQELELLPGIGPALSQRIIDYRTQHGPFQSVSQLTLVSGIGLSKLDQIVDYITVGGPP